MTPARGAEDAQAQDTSVADRFAEMDEEYGPAAVALPEGAEGAPWADRMPNGDPPDLMLWGSEEDSV